MPPKQTLIKKINDNLSYHVSKVSLILTIKLVYPYNLWARAQPPPPPLQEIPVEALPQGQRGGVGRNHM